MKITHRQQTEATFHDRYASTVALHRIKVFDQISLSYQEARKTLSLFGEIKGKRILDLGCGFGEMAVFLALQGARVEAVDISPGMIKLAKKLARIHGASSLCHFQVAAAETLRFKSNSFDFVFGDGVLHHVSLSETLKQIYRVLKPGGLAAFIEPLAYNPVINIYRQLAQKVRTPHEAPLRFSDITKIKYIFPETRHQEYHLFTLLIFVWFFLVQRINPSQQRYWVKFRQLNHAANLAVAPLVFLDKLFLTLFPPLRYLCWNTLIILKK